MCRRTEGRAAHDSRPRRESVRKRLGKKRCAMLDARDGHRCVYCGLTREESVYPLELDHIVPREHGGTDELHNLVTACKSCNSARQSMTLPEWARYAQTKLGLTFTARGIRAHAKKVHRESLTPWLAVAA